MVWGISTLKITVDLQQMFPLDVQMKNLRYFSSEDSSIFARNVPTGCPNERFLKITVDLQEILISVHSNEKLQLCNYKKYSHLFILMKDLRYFSCEGDSRIAKHTPIWLSILERFMLFPCKGNSRIPRPIFIFHI